MGSYWSWGQRTLLDASQQKSQKCYAGEDSIAKEIIPPVHLFGVLFPAQVQRLRWLCLSNVLLCALIMILSQLKSSSFCQRQRYCACASYTHESELSQTYDFVSVSEKKVKFVQTEASPAWPNYFFLLSNQSYREEWKEKAVLSTACSPCGLNKNCISPLSLHRLPLRFMSACQRTELLFFWTVVS